MPGCNKDSSLEFYCLPSRISRSGKGGCDLCPDAGRVEKGWVWRYWQGWLMSTARKRYPATVMTRGLLPAAFRPWAIRPSLCDQVPDDTPDPIPCRRHAWPGRSVSTAKHQPGLLLSLHPPPHASQSLGLQALATTPGRLTKFLRSYTFSHLFLPYRLVKILNTSVLLITDTNCC